jgi:hypothetical protein
MSELLLSPDTRDIIDDDGDVRPLDEEVDEMIRQSRSESYDGSEVFPGAVAQQIYDTFSQLKEQYGRNGWVNKTLRDENGRTPGQVIAMAQLHREITPDEAGYLLSEFCGAENRTETTPAQPYSDAMMRAANDHQ